MCLPSSNIAVLHVQNAICAKYRMPELPEVETTRRGLAPIVVGQQISDIVIRNRHLRWPIPAELARLTRARTVQTLSRRGKYLLWDVDAASGGGHLLTHLGMSGSLTVHKSRSAPGPHDHVDIALSSGAIVRYHDPRRFGAMLWISGPLVQHPLLDKLGPEPLTPDFDGAHLFRTSRGKSTSIKSFIMDAHIVVGVGNIYASEALFLAGIHPATPAGRVSRVRHERLAAAIRTVLAEAIQRGGSSLRDYVQADGATGYFQLDVRVYGREGEACRQCSHPIRAIKQGQRTTYYCVRCQR